MDRPLSRKIGIAASMSTMHKLAAALGVKMTFFFETL
jgi:hypothetical protein